MTEGWPWDNDDPPSNVIYLVSRKKQDGFCGGRGIQIHDNPCVVCGFDNDEQHDDPPEAA